MSMQLLPCPFCGQRAEMDTMQGYRSIEGKLGNRIAVYCTECCADLGICREDFPGVSDEAIIQWVTQQWNKRSPVSLVFSEKLNKDDGPEVH